MKRIKAIYEGGIFRPLEPVGVPEHGEVELSIHPPGSDQNGDVVQAAQSVFNGLAEAEIDEILCVALDRARFGRSGA